MSRKLVKNVSFIEIHNNVILSSFGPQLILQEQRRGDDFQTVIKAARDEDFLGKLISLGAILNLLVFFFFIQKKQDFRARGVLLATILVAIITFIIKL